MTNGRKIDLALEAKELAEQSTQETTALSGVKAREEKINGFFPLTWVEILDDAGQRALGKPKGTYLTLTLPQLPQGREEVCQCAQAVAETISRLNTLPKEGPILVAGLGNRQVTPDALGPKTTDALLVTRHLQGIFPHPLRPIAALAPGVTGQTGMESGELLQGVIHEVHPSCLIAIDALAARRQERVCRTIQICDTGIVPGSGVGNARMALDAKTLGIPVIAVGVPTVVEAATLCLDLLEEKGDFDPSLFRREGEEWFVTPRSIDHEIAILSQILGLGISSALHVDFSVEDVDNLLF